MAGDMAGYREPEDIQCDEQLRQQAIIDYLSSR